MREDLVDGDDGDDDYRWLPTHKTLYGENLEKKGIVIGWISYRYDEFRTFGLYTLRGVWERLGEKEYYVLIDFLFYKV